jgi:hypothetical protein
VLGWLVVVRWQTGVLRLLVSDRVVADIVESHEISVCPGVQMHGWDFWK